MESINKVYQGLYKNKSKFSRKTLKNEIMVVSLEEKDFEILKSIDPVYGEVVEMLYTRLKKAYPGELSDFQMGMTSPTSIRHNIVIFFPEFNIENTRGDSYKIRELYVTMELSFSSTPNLVLPKIYGVCGERGVLKRTEYRSGYMHSHLRQGAFYGGNTFCLGDTTVNSCLAEIHENAIRPYNDSKYDENSYRNEDNKYWIYYELLLSEINSYVRHESLEGGPYMRISQHISAVAGMSKSPVKRYRYTINHVNGIPSNILANLFGVLITTRDSPSGISIPQIHFSREVLEEMKKYNDSRSIIGTVDGRLVDIPGGYEVVKSKSVISSVVNKLKKKEPKYTTLNQGGLIYRGEFKPIRILEDLEGEGPTKKIEEKDTYPNVNLINHVKTYIENHEFRQDCHNWARKRHFERRKSRTKTNTDTDGQGTTENTVSMQQNR